MRAVPPHSARVTARTARLLLPPRARREDKAANEGQYGEDYTRMVAAWCLWQTAAGNDLATRLDSCPVCLRNEVEVEEGCILSCHHRPARPHRPLPVRCGGGSARRTPSHAAP